MPLFQYQALDNTGKKRSGFIEAIDEAEVKAKLREQGLMISSLSTKASISTKQNLSNDALQTFTLQLSQLVNSDVPLFQSLAALEEQSRGEPYHRIILSLCDQIKSGRTLSDAMASYPKSFDRLYCSMVKAGESAGALGIVLERLNQWLTKQNKLRKQLWTALIYPGVLAVFALGIIGLMLGFVLPSVEGILENRETNTFTQAVISTSRFLRAYWWAYMPLILGLLAFAYFKLQSPQGKLWLQKTVIRLPIFKTVVIQTSIARFCRSMGTLQLGGLTMIDSLRLSREVIGNVVIEEELRKAEEKIIEGSSLSQELVRSKWIPKMVSRMLLVGEEAGSTVAMFNKIAEVYEDDVERTLDRLLALATPVILLIMGTIIGIIMLAILLPLTDVSSFGS